MPESAIQQMMQIALQHHQAGRLTQAESLYRQVLAQQPENADALHLLGVIARQVGRNDIAVDLIGQAIALEPNFPEACSSLGNALRDIGRLDEAIAAYRQAIALKPRYPEAHSNLGMTLKARGSLADAITAFRQAIAVRPNLPEAHNNLGNALREIGQLGEAIAAFRQALVLKPDLAEAHSNLGNALRDVGQLDEAIAAYRQAIALKPDSPEAHCNLGTALHDSGQLDEATVAYRQAIGLKPDLPQAHSNLLYAIHFHPGFDAQAIAEEHRRWNRRYAEPLRKSIRPHANDRNPDRRLRIGYVSPDFREHPVGRFLLPLLTHHDRNRVEVFAYAQVAVPDAMTERLRSCTAGWRNIVGVSDSQAADLIRQDQIDILVDLTMHMAHNRLLVFARKPAPVQVTYLAYCASTGLETIDYRLSDPYLDPPGSEESFYSEKTIRLPRTYWCYQPGIATPDINLLPAHEHGHVTFGCLNNFCKVNELTLAAWARILGAVPSSRLLLHAPDGSHRQRVRGRLRQDGIEPDRVRFVGRVSLPDYFRLHHGIDIALDTFPYAGGTTTCDALWMGVPVASVAGKTAVGRAGMSILSNVGLPELVADSEEGYVRIAHNLANDLPRLSKLRSTLRRRMERSPLMDAPRHARDIEAAYGEMWRRWCATAIAS